MAADVGVDVDAFCSQLFFGYSEQVDEGLTVLGIVAEPPIDHVQRLLQGVPAIVTGGLR